MARILNPIRATAVICVAATSIYIMWMGNKLTNILASPDWCGKALQAEKISAQNFGGLTACVDLLKIQLNAIARGYLVYAGVIALCLLTLIVIVVAGAKFSGEGFGAKIDIDRADPASAAPAAAQAVADSAQDTADTMKDATP